MQSEDYLSLLRRAAGSEYGLRLRVAEPRATSRVRRRLYHAREKRRHRGDHSLDQLSILTRHVRSSDQNRVDLLVIRRDRMGSPQKDDGHRVEAAPLAVEDVPVTILARGPRRQRPPLESLLFSSFFRGISSVSDSVKREPRGPRSRAPGGA